MPRRLNSHAKARDQIRAIANSGLPAEALATRLMTAIQVAIPCEGYRLFGLDPTTSLINCVLAASDSDGWARLEWLRGFYLAGVLDYVEQAFIVKMGLPAIAFQERQDICWGYPEEVLSRLTPREHRELFEASRGPAGGTIVAHFPSGEKWIAMLQMYRRDRSCPFEATDVAFLRRHLRVMGEAIATAIRRERALTNHVVPDGSGVLIIGPNQKLSVVNRAGEVWLSRMVDADKDGHAPVPAAVWSAIAQLRSHEGRVAGVVTAPTSFGDVRVEASQGAEDGSFAIVLGPLRPFAIPELPSSWILTRQERRIVELLLRGLGNREISTSLTVSENTVEFHLRNAYDKLGVRSRSQLLARFFQENFYPELEAGFERP